jgi:hypothetical protein
VTVQPGSLVVETNVATAVIYLDAEYVGAGTATLQRPPGEYTLRITSATRSASTRTR